jgi:hypothetical protein
MGLISVLDNMEFEELNTWLGPLLCLWSLWGLNPQSRDYESCRAERGPVAGDGTG